MIAVEVAHRTDTGGRRHNEDACGHWHDERHLVCVVADGAGGHGGGATASRLVVQAVIERFAAEPATDARTLAAQLRETNHALIDARRAGTEQADMHSTAVCLVVDYVAQRALWAHAGDSRLYHFRDGRLLARTQDHSLVQSLLDAGLIGSDGLRGHPKRSELRSALGVPPDQLEVSAGGADIEPGDAFLLCTDGLWEHVDDAEVLAALAEAQAGGDGPEAWLSALDARVRSAVAGRSNHDNFTALAVWTGAAGPA